MELLLFLLLLAAVSWLILLPSRIAGGIRRHRVAGAGVIAAVAIGGYLLLQLAQPSQPPADYTQGDAALRALLE